MKKRIIISLLCGLVICCMAVYSFGTTGIVNTDTLRLRKSDSTDSAILTLLSQDDKVEILARTENGWYKVKYIDKQTQKEYEGYVSADYITVKEDETIPTTEKSEENESSEGENNVPQQQEENKTNPTEETGTEEKVEESTTKIINQGEKVYMIPLINSNTVNILEKDITVEVVAELNGWSYVVSDNFEGWIRSEKLQSLGENKKIGYVNANSVNFREQPDTSGEPITTLSRNNEVEILEENNGWTKIRYNGVVGYISTKYLSSTKVEVTSRSSTSRRTKTNTLATANSSNENTVTETSTSEASNATTSEIIAYAKKYLGYKYVAGGSGPSGFDCSGFTQYVYKHFGYSLSRTSSGQANDGTAVSKANLRQGDIVCFSGSSGSKKISHAGIYIGGGKFIHSANSRKGVIISNIDGDGYFYVCARRIIN